MLATQQRRRQEIVADEVVDVEAVQRRLVADRRRLEATRAAVACSADASSLESTGELVSHDDHQADAASDTFEREVQASVLHGIDAELAAIDHAQARLRAGTYGTCETCAGPIGAARLAANPLATRCLADQLHAEQLDRSLRSEVLHGPAEAEATHNILLVPDLEEEETLDLAAEERALHWDVG